MKKRILFIMLSVLIIASLTACSVKSESAIGTTESTVFSTTNAESTTEKGITESETTTLKSESSEITTTTTRPAEQKSSGQTTTKKVTTTQNQTTTQKQTVVQSQTTTQKVTTQKQNVTQRQTTTKKVTTTVAPYWCDEGGTHHSCNVGPIGWVNSYDEAEKKALEYAGQNGDSGNFLVKECHNCGRFTAYVTFD